MDKAERADEGGLEQQLDALYEEREYLEREIGTADAREIVQMIRSLEAQLVDLYGEKENGEAR